MKLNTIFIDLDDTIYPHASGVWPRIRSRIDQYLLEVMQFDPQEAASLRRQMVEQYGTTLRGLQTMYQVDEASYLAFVHDVPVEDLLKPDPELRKMLAGIQTRKFIFTNADHIHANRVLAVLDVAACFDDIIDIHRLAPYCKPMVEAYQIAMSVAGENDPNNCLLVDDMPANLDAARNLGFHTILVRDAGLPSVAENHHVVIQRLTDLPQALDAWGHT